MTPITSQLNIKDRPVTFALILLLAVSFITFWSMRSAPMGFDLIFSTRNPLNAPWTFLTYPLFPAGGLLAVLLGGWWLWGIGGIVEREMGSLRYLALIVLVTLLAPICMWLGSMAMKLDGTLAGYWMILPTVTVAWATRHPGENVLFMLMLPIQARWIGWISVLFVFFGSPPQLAPFAVIPLALVWALADGRLPIPYRATPKREGARSRSGLPIDDAFLSDVYRREREREERERLRKLFEDGLIDNEDKGKDQ